MYVYQQASDLVRRRRPQAVVPQGTSYWVQTQLGKISWGSTWGGYTDAAEGSQLAHITNCT